MSLKKLLQKADKIATLKQVTAGFEHPTKNANNMLPGKRKNPSKPDKHIRADSMTEINFVKDTDLEKAFSYKGTIRPDGSDKDGMAHPDASKPYVKGTSKHGPAWFYKPEVAKQHEQKFMSNYNGFIHKLSPEGRKHMHSLGRQVAMDPDKHAIPTGTPDGQALRLRHLTAAMGGRPGYSISEVPGGLNITAERHSGNRDNLGESHTWHFDGKNLKFLGKMSKSSIQEGDHGRQKVGRSDRRSEEVGGSYSNPGRGRPGSSRSSLAKDSDDPKGTRAVPGQKDRKKPSLRVHDGGRVDGVRQGSERDKKRHKGTWRAKLHGQDGYHRVVTVHPPTVDSRDQGNHYELEGHGLVHQREIEDLQISEKLEKYFPLGDDESNIIGGLFSGQNDEGFKHVSSKPIEGTDLYHHVYQDKDPGRDTWHHVISKHPESHKKGVSEIYVSHEPEYFEGGKYVHFSAVSPKHKGQGLGRVAYHEAIKHHGELHSDSKMTNRAMKVWQSLDKHPDFKVDFAKPKSGDGHKVTYVGKSKDSLKKAFEMMSGTESLHMSEDLNKALPEGKIYVAFDGDNAGSQVERAALRDDTEAIRDISNRISSGSAIITEYARKYIDPTMEVIVSGGDDLGFLMSNKVTRKDIDVLRRIYREKAGFTITAGMGQTIPNATRAMLYGKITGKNKTVVWNEQVEAKLNELARDETPKEKVKGILTKSKAYIGQKLEKYSQSHKIKEPRVGVGISSMKRRPENANHKQYNSLNKSEAKTKNIEVAIIAVRDGDYILMGRRRDSGKFTNPGGHLEGNETPMEGALRELKEETGIQARKLKKMGSRIVKQNGKTLRIHCFEYNQGRKSTTVQNDPDGECLRWQYINTKDGLPEEVRNNLHVSKENVLLDLLNIKY